MQIFLPFQILKGLIAFNQNVENCILESELVRTLETHQ